MPLDTATSLQIMGMRGEGHIGDSAWVVKSHHPLVIPNSRVFKSNKTFICVRNPLDVFPSYAAMTNTMSHGNKPEYEIHEMFPEWWNWWVKRQTVVMKNFFDTLRNDCNTKGKNPLYIVRYEDLVLKPKDTLMGLFSFLLGVPAA